LPAQPRRSIQVHEGASAQSYGLAVARFARLPPEVIDAAAKRLEELEPGTGAAGSVDGSAEERRAMELLRRFAAVPLEPGMPPEALAAALQEHALELCQ
jgi:DNA mismatch repair ATPase MutS